MGHAEGDEEWHVRDGVLDRLEQGADTDADADHAQRAGGVLAPEAVELGADVEEPQHGEEAADGDGDTAVERVQVPAFLEVEALEDGNGEEAEAEGAESDDHRLDGPDLHEPGERRVEGDRQWVLFDERFAEHVDLLPLAAWRLLQEEGGDRQQRHRDAEEVVGPAPAVDLAGPVGGHGHGADEDRAENRHEAC